MKLKVTYRLSKESIRPASLALFCELEEFDCNFIPINPLIGTGKIVKELWIEWKLFDSISEIIHAILNGSSFLYSFLCEFQPESIVLEVFMVGVLLEIKRDELGFNVDIVRHTRTIFSCLN